MNKRQPGIAIRILLINSLICSFQSVFKAKEGNAALLTRGKVQEFCDELLDLEK